MRFVSPSFRNHNSGPNIKEGGRDEYRPARVILSAREEVATTEVESLMGILLELALPLVHICPVLIVVAYVNVSKGANCSGLNLPCLVAIAGF